MYSKFDLSTLRSFQKLNEPSHQLPYRFFLTLIIKLPRYCSDEKKIKIEIKKNEQIILIVIHYETLTLSSVLTPDQSLFQHSNNFFYKFYKTFLKRGLQSEKYLEQTST